MILELCSGGTLKSWIANRYEQGVSKMPVYMAPSRSLVANCLWQILDATRYLHEQGFVHRDVKHLNSIGSKGADSIPSLSEIRGSEFRLLSRDGFQRLKSQRVPDRKWPCLAFRNSGHVFLWMRSLPPPCSICRPENLLVLKTSFRPQLKLADFNVATAFQRQAKAHAGVRSTSACNPCQGGVDDQALWFTGLYGA